MNHPPGERVPPELALARLELRQICLLAVHPMLTAAERQVFGAEHERALAEARVVLGRHATRHEGASTTWPACSSGSTTCTPRSVLSGVLYAPAPPVSQRRRLLGYDPGWASCVLTHMGDAAILVGLGLGLHLGGHPAWGAATVLAALFRLLATMLRVASGQHGFRIPRLSLDRAATALALPVAVIAAAVVPPEGPGVVAGVPVAVVALGTMAAIGVVEIARTVYWALCRRRLFRRAAVALGGLVPDVIVAHTADGIVVNLQREATTRPPVFDLADDDRHLHAVGDDAAGRGGGGGRQRRARSRRRPRS